MPNLSVSSKCNEIEAKGFITVLDIDLLGQIALF
jgi:hypothetical protein